jgi:hypothetical protein
MWLEDRVRFHFEAQRFRALDRAAPRVEFRKERFDYALAKLLDGTGMPYRVKWDRLAAIGIRPDSRCNLFLGRTSLSSGLFLVCCAVGNRGAQADYRIVDGVLTFSTADDFEAPLVSRHYPVGDITSPDGRTSDSDPALAARRDDLRRARSRWIEQSIERGIFNGFHDVHARGAAVRCDGEILHVMAPSWQLPYVHEFLEQQRRLLARVRRASPAQ